jgi:hypothetical protein
MSSIRPLRPSPADGDLILANHRQLVWWKSSLGGAVFEGYPGLWHGGVTTALLDGAMTNYHFAHGIEALTAELTVRYRHLVDVRGGIAERASPTESRGNLRLLDAEPQQQGQVKATALGKFIEKHE